MTLAFLLQYKYTVHMCQAYVSYRTCLFQAYARSKSLAFAFAFAFVSVPNDKQVTCEDIRTWAYLSTVASVKFPWFFAQRRDVTRLRFLPSYINFSICYYWGLSISSDCQQKASVFRIHSKRYTSYTVLARLPGAALTTTQLELSRLI
jgi:hypothetical protein